MIRSISRLLILLSLVAVVSFGQAQEKPPIAVTDTVRTIGGYPVTVNVMKNDIYMEGHDVSVFKIDYPYSWDVTRKDSIVTITPPPRYHDPSEIHYTLRDHDNYMMSEPGRVLVLFDSIDYKLIKPNSFRTLINPFGTQFWNISTTYPFLKPNEFSIFEINDNPNRTLCDVNSLWIAGKDEQNNLHLSAERMRHGPFRMHFGSRYGNDFFLGPVQKQNLVNDTVISHSINWNRMWIISRDDIEQFYQNYENPGYEIPEAITNWPGNGDTSTGQEPILAPFYDQNANGKFEPQLGDYPQIRGDSCYFFIFNDQSFEHTETGGIPLGLEVHGMVYAFGLPEDSALYNTLFFRYSIINRSDTNYHEVYLGNWADMYIGNASDDYVGCDTALNAFFTYNAEAYDRKGTHTNFEDHPPSIGVKFLNQELDHFIYNFKYDYFDPPDSIDLYTPIEPYEYYLNLQGKWLDTTHLTYGGTGYGGDTPVNHAFPGDLHNPDEWSELSAGNEPQTKYSLGSTGPFDLPAGDTLTLDFAIVYARDYNGDHISSVDLLKERMATIQTYYDNDSVPGGSFTGLEEQEKPGEYNTVKIYPNPCANKLNIDLPQNEKTKSVSIISMQGREIRLPQSITSGYARLNTQKLKPGIYLLKINTDKFIYTQKFIKRP
ncbi:MAG: T9SS type A sorting domain-containing protein [Bacteroidales bacterium]|nr:T9SS type A sorting domain-containing protein [Bacteroidales bacterium]